MSARDWARAIQATRAWQDAPAATLPTILQDRVQAPAQGNAPAWADRPALIGPDGALTHGQLAARARAQSRRALRAGLPAGAVVALLMPNCPDYVAIWLGLTGVGCVVALLNTTLPVASLRQALASADATLLIADASLAATAAAAVAGTAIGLHVHDPHDPTDDAPLTPAEQRPPVAQDRALLIYTSGTTGLPKAANLSHARVLEWSAWFAALIDATPDDRMYNCLPLYHSTGGVVAVGCMLLAGGSVVIRPRFSASLFWADVAATGCTVMQYIGELCRYLLAHPDPPAPHRLRLACGNGLRADVWQGFQDRFAIPRILEFYAATEGSVSLYNLEGRVGAIGRVPGYLAQHFPIALIALDDAGAPLRDADGRCRRCGPDEPGEAIGPVGTGARRFEGYTDAAASAAKLIADVFAPGDRWFRTGDLMRRDAAGFHYFINRLGDTFRWKGENVSTTEVAGVLAQCPGVADAAVFGVAIAGYEGKAGMAAVVPGPAFVPADLHEHMQRHLPPHARPLFIRIVAALDSTATFKRRTVELARDGYTDVGADPLWFADAAAGRLVTADAALIATLHRRRL